MRVITLYILWFLFRICILHFWLFAVCYLRAGPAGGLCGIAMGISSFSPISGFLTLYVATVHSGFRGMRILVKSRSDD